MKFENFPTPFTSDFDINKVKPLKYNVLIKVKEFLDKFTDTNGLLVFEHRRYDNYAEIIKIGSKVKEKYGEIYNIREGDIVYISNPAVGQCIKRIDGYSYMIIPVVAIEGKIEQK